MVLRIIFRLALFQFHKFSQACTPYKISYTYIYIQVYTCTQVINRYISKIVSLTITEKEHKLITTIYTLKIAYGTTFIFNQHW